MKPRRVGSPLAVGWSSLMNWDVVVVVAAVVVAPLVEVVVAAVVVVVLVEEVALGSEEVWVM